MSRSLAEAMSRDPSGTTDQQASRDRGEADVVDAEFTDVDARKS